MASNSNGIIDSMTGPCQNMMQTCFGGLDTMARGFDPVVKSVTQANLEAIGLWNRRTQAYLELSSRLSQCRTPQDLVAEQMRFWQTAVSQYQDSSRKIVEHYAHAMPELPFRAPKSGGRTAKSERDYLTFPEHNADGTRNDDKRRRAA